MADLPELPDADAAPRSLSRRQDANREGVTFEPLDLSCICVMRKRGSVGSHAAAPFSKDGQVMMMRRLGAVVLAGGLSVLLGASAYAASSSTALPPPDPTAKNLTPYMIKLRAFEHTVEEARPYRPLFPPGAPDRD